MAKFKPRKINRRQTLEQCVKSSIDKYPVIMNELRRSEMTNETKHTSTPWSIKVGDETVIMDVDGYTIIDTAFSDFDLNDTDKPNAAHIVKCVNMHEELVKNIIELMDNYDSMCWNNFSCGAEGNEAYDNLTATLKKAGAL